MGLKLAKGQAWPAGQEKHVLFPAALYSPELHAVLAPFVQEKPAGQIRQFADA